MKAVRLEDTRVLQLRDIATPAHRSDEVLARVLYCGICGTDLHAAENRAFAPGVILGHEFSGEIVEVGAEVLGWRPGDRFVANPNGAVCGECPQCRAGRPNLCKEATQQKALGVSADGGMAEYVALDPRYLNRVPDDLSAQEAALVEPLAVAVRAVRTAGLSLGDRVAVVGLGAVGQLVLQVAKAAGAGELVGIEQSEYRRSVAARLGATRVRKPGDPAPSSSSGDGFDIVFECSGAPTALQDSISMLRPGGAVRLVGMAPTPISFEPVDAIMREVRILSGFIYAPQDFRIAITLLSGGRINLEPLISRVVPLEAFEEAFDLMRNPESVLKVLIQP